MTTQPLLPENKEVTWKYEYEQISPRVDINASQTISLIPETPIQWFTTIMPSHGDTEKEKEEYRNAQIEQLKLGIIKMAPPTQVIPQMPTTQINLQGGSIGQPIQIGKPVEFDVLPGEKKPVSGGVSNKILDSLMGSQVNNKKKLGPNDLCSCGSGKKAKKCCYRGKFS